MSEEQIRFWTYSSLNATVVDHETRISALENGGSGLALSPQVWDDPTDLTQADEIWASLLASKIIILEPSGDNLSYNVPTNYTFTNGQVLCFTNVGTYNIDIHYGSIIVLPITRPSKSKPVIIAVLNAGDTVSVVWSSALSRFIVINGVASIRAL